MSYTDAVEVADLWEMMVYLSHSHGLSPKDLQDLSPADVQELYVAALRQEAAK